MTTKELREELKEEQKAKSRIEKYDKGDGWAEDNVYYRVEPSLSELCCEHLEKGDYDQKIIEDLLVEIIEKEAYIGIDDIVEVAKKGKVNNQKILEAIIKKEYLGFLIKFVNAVPNVVTNTNKSQIESAFFKLFHEETKEMYNYYAYDFGYYKWRDFIKNHGINIELYEDALIKSIINTIESTRKKTENEADKMNHAIPMIDHVAYFLCKFAQDFKNANKEKLRNTLIELNCFYAMKRFAEEIEGESIEFFIDAVIAKKDAKSILEFAQELCWDEGYDISKLQDAIIKTNDIDRIIEFTSIKGSNIEELEKVIYENVNGEQLNFYYDTYIHQVFRNKKGKITGHRRRETNYGALCFAAVRTEHYELINKILSDLGENATLINSEMLTKFIKEIIKFIKKSKDFDVRILTSLVQNKEIDKKEKETLVGAIIENAIEFKIAKHIKHFIELNIQQEVIEEVVCEFGESEDIYDIALKTYDKKNLARLIETIKKRGNAEYIFAFAVNVKDLTYIEKLQLMKLSIEQIQTTIEATGEEAPTVREFMKRIEFAPSTNE